MLFKLLGVEIANQQAGIGRKFRQVFLTQSHVLAHRVSEYYSKLVRAADYTNGVGSGVNGGDEDLFQLDEEDDERKDLPEKFSDLQDKHFPLFATFDQVGQRIRSSRS